MSLCVCVYLVSVLHPIWTPRCLCATCFHTLNHILVLEPLTPFGNVYVSYFCIVPLRPGSSAGRTPSSQWQVCRFLLCYRGDVFMDISGLLRCVPAALAVCGMRPRLPRRAQRRRLSSVKGEQPAEAFGGSSSSLRLLALSRRRLLIKDGPMWR